VTTAAAGGLGAGAGAGVGAGAGLTELPTYEEPATMGGVGIGNGATANHGDVSLPMYAEVNEGGDDAEYAMAVPDNYAVRDRFSADVRTLRLRSRQCTSASIARAPLYRCCL
jgi:hypothetical protein